MKITHCATAPMQFTCLVLSGATFKGLVSFLSQFSTTTHHYFLLWDHWIRTQIYKFKKQHRPMQITTSSLALTIISTPQ